MDKREKLFKNLNSLVLFILFSAAAAVSFYLLSKGNIYNGILVILSVPMLLIPSIFYRIFRLEPIYSLNFLAYLFISFAYTLGVALSGYNKIPLLDKAAHTFSGVFFTFIGLILIYTLKPEKKLSKEDFPMIAIFSVSFSLAVAAIWEIIEYLINFIAKNDPQKVKTTGVNDTMLDIIVCTIGSLFFLIPIYLYFYKNKKSFLMGIYNTLTQKSGEG